MFSLPVGEMVLLISTPSSSRLPSVPPEYTICFCSCCSAAVLSVVPISPAAHTDAGTSASSIADSTLRASHFRSRFLLIIRLFPLLFSLIFNSNYTFKIISTEGYIIVKNRYFRPFPVMQEIKEDS